MKAKHLKESPLWPKNNMMLKMEYPYRTSGKYGHRKRYRKADESLPHGIKSTDTSEFSRVLSKSGPMKETKKTVIINIASTTKQSQENIQKDQDTSDKILGPLSDIGTPY